MKVPIAFIIGDCEGHDKLCGRFGTHHLENAMVCRDCDCSTNDLDDPNVSCSPMLVERIQNLAGDLDGLKQISHHNIQNAFDGLCFGGDNEGIHGCSPPEMLHLYQQGLYKYALSAFFQLMTNQQKSLFDNLVSEISQVCCRQSDRSFPRFRFPKGVSNLTKFTAAEQVAVVLLCFIALCSKKFRTLMQKHAGKGVYVVDNDVVDLCRGFAILFEQMLVVESWINSEIHSKVQVTNEAPQIISHFMENYKATVNRTTGNGLKIPKFHQLKHMPRYILKFGSPQNFSTSRCESHHIVMSKQPAKYAQKRDSCFESQVGSRIVDNIVLLQANQMLLQSAVEPVSQSSAFSGCEIFHYSTGCT